MYATCSRRRLEAAARRSMLDNLARAIDSFARMTKFAAEVRVAQGGDACVLSVAEALPRRGLPGAMVIKTTRFGAISIEAHDVLEFPTGIPGLEDCKQWVLLADAGNDALAWLQCTTRPEVALAVVSPRRFVLDYQLRVSSSELAPLALARSDDAKVLVIVGRRDEAITLNLKAPLVINLERRLGRQVINNADLPVDHVIRSEHARSNESAAPARAFPPLRKSA